MVKHTFKRGEGILVEDNGGRSLLGLCFLAQKLRPTISEATAGVTESCLKSGYPRAAKQ
ncbi:MAG: hypothetical protein Q8R29_02320 [bacterium]|nr:hypothetical protein [bacterium]